MSGSTPLSDDRDLLVLECDYMDLKLPIHETFDSVKASPTQSLEVAGGLWMIEESSVQLRMDAQLLADLTKVSSLVSRLISESDSRLTREINASLDKLISKEQFQEIKRQLLLFQFSSELCPRVSEHLDWATAVGELAGAWYPIMGKGFLPKMVHADQTSPAAELAKFSRESFPVKPVLVFVGNLLEVSCQLREYFELEVANWCDVGDKIIPFLRVNIHCFVGPFRVNKEQRSKEFDVAKGVLKKDGLLQGVEPLKQSKSPGTRSRLANRTTPPVKKGSVGGGISKGSKIKCMPGQHVKGKRCHKCGGIGHICAVCPN